MKKLVLLLFINLFLCFFIVSNEKISVSKSELQNVKNFQKPWDFSLYKASSTPKRGGYIAGCVVGGIGTGLFTLNHFIHILITLIAPPVMTDDRGETLISRPLNIGIMATGWIPIIGPFANLGILIVMSRNTLYSFYGSSSFYESMMVYCGLLGVLEIIFMAMMIAGFSIAAKNKGYNKSELEKITPIISTSYSLDKPDLLLGLKIKL